MEVLSKVGYLNYQQVNSQFNLSKGRIDKLIRNSFLEKVSYLDKDMNGDFAIRLAGKGKRLCKKQLNINHIYKSISIKHDLALAEIYLSLDDSKKETWITGNELQIKFERYLDRLKEKNLKKYIKIKMAYENKEISIVDSLYKDNEDKIAVEVITKNYSKKMIKAKKNYAKIINSEFKEIKI